MIIAAHNEQDFIEDAIASVFDQITSFDFELIVVDDGSTDSTLKIVSLLLQGRSNCTVVALQRNFGKGHAIHKAYSLAKGRYIQILDADDYLIHPNKFQKQVNFLDSHLEISAVAHNTLTIMKDSANVITLESEEKTYSMEDILRFNVYFHTSSLMIRKLGSNLPDYFTNVESLRGDSAFLYFHLFELRGGVHYFPELMSVYRIHEKGIWSRMSPLAKLELTKRLFIDLQNYVVRDENCIEHAWLERKVNEIGIVGENGFSPVVLPKLSVLLKSLMLFAGQVYIPEINAEISTSINISWGVDGVSKALGSVVLNDVRNRTPEVGTLETPPCVAILVSGFRQEGGGIFKEILNLIRIHKELGYKVIVISSQMSEEMIVEFPPELQSNYCTLHRVDEKDFHLKLEEIFRIILDCKPERLYALISHHDVVANAVLQPRLANSLILYFVYDHISSLGVTNPSVDLILVKFAQQAVMLESAGVHNKYVITSPFVSSSNKINPHHVFSRNTINSATASARSYKIEGQFSELFKESIGKLLSQTDGFHFHYGPLSDEIISEVKDHLAALSINPERIHFLPFTRDFQKDLLRRRVHLFVVTSSLLSLNTALEFMACGIPALVYSDDDPKVLLNPKEVFGLDQLFWRNMDDFVQALSSLDNRSLQAMSISAFNRYSNYFSLSNAVNAFQELKMASLNVSLATHKNQSLERFESFTDIYGKVFTR